MPLASPPSNTANYPCRIACAAGVTALYAIVMFLMTFPLLGVPILFFDDGETLYNVFALLNDKLPYQDFYTHHFVGYVLPIYVLAKITGYFPDIIRYSFVINQTLLGLGTYLCAKRFFSTRISALSGLLAITARMPFVISFFPLYQISVCFVFILHLSLSFLSKGKYFFLSFACLLTGVAFCIDQRGLLLIVIPLLTILGRIMSKSETSLSRSILSTGTFFLAPLAAGATLYYSGVFSPFLEQTLMFPSQFRVASLTLTDQFLLAIKAHRHLISETPLLVVLGLTGFIGLVRAREHTSLALGATVIAVTLFFLVFISGRDFAYYSIPWLPFLALLAPFSLSYWEQFRLLKKTRYLLLIAPILVTALSIPSFLQMIPLLRSRNDAILVADYLRNTMKESDSLFVFSYRPDIYASIPKLSAFPFVNTLYIHPDPAITFKDERIRHLNPVMQEDFFNRFRADPPDFLVIFKYQVEGIDWSPAAEFLQEQVTTRYEKLHDFVGPTVKGTQSTIAVYKHTQ